MVERTPSTGEVRGGTLAKAELGRWKQEGSEFKASLGQGSVSK